MKITYLGTASVLLDYAGLRLMTDPVFDPPGSSYSMGPSYVPAKWFLSTKQYDTPLTVEQVGQVDALLLSHDHHRDNLDRAGRDLALSDQVRAVITNPHAARRLSRYRKAVTGLASGQSTTIGEVTVTAIVAQHGPRFIPQTGQVTGFLLESPKEPTVWISGDTVLSPTLAAAAAGLRKRGIDVAIINAGGVKFPTAPGVGKVVFTFDPGQFVEVCTLIDPRVIIPVHRSGWTHFQPETDLHKALDGAGLLGRTRWLELGETTEVQ